MGKYIARRLTLMVPTVLLVAIVVFVVLRIMPGDVADVILGAEGPREAKERIREYLNQRLHMNEAFHVQFFYYVKDLVRGDLGESLWNNRPVTEEIIKRFPRSLQLAVMGAIFAILISVPAGIIAAIRQDQPADYIARVAAIFALSMPSFWTATMVVVFMGIWFKYSPPTAYVGLFESPWDNLQKMIFPALVIGAIFAGSQARMIRSALLEVLRQDYVRTAWAKGLRERVVIYRHAVKNALIPVVTIMGIQFANLLGGTVIVETIFNVPGLGLMLLEAINRRDLPVVQGGVLFFSLLLLTINLLVDLLYAWLDPRIKYG